MSQLQTYRDQIDQIDQKIQELILQRMNVVASIAEYKISQDLPVYDHGREEAVIKKNMDRIQNSPYAMYYQPILEEILKESKEFQKAIILRSTL